MTRKSDLGQYGLAPMWWLTLDIPSTAFKVLVALACHANKENEAWPSRKTLAEETGCSTTTVDRGLKALTDVGVIDVVGQYDDNGDRTVNLYTVYFVQPAEGQQVLSGGGLDYAPTQKLQGGPRGNDEGGPREPEARVAAEPMTQGEQVQGTGTDEQVSEGAAASQQALVPVDALPPLSDLEAAKERRRAVTAALVECWRGTDEGITRSELTLTRKVGRELAEAGATPDEVRRRWAAMGEAGWERSTPAALSKHWGALSGGGKSAQVSAVNASVPDERFVVR